jgi:ankyrin repeat protein
VEVIRILLDQGADPTAKASDGMTPFHFASLSGHVEVIRILLEQGADPTAKAYEGMTPFHIASSRRTCGSDSDTSRSGRRSDSKGQ